MLHLNKIVSPFIVFLLGRHFGTLPISVFVCVLGVDQQAYAPPAISNRRLWLSNNEYNLSPGPGLALSLSGLLPCLSSLTSKPHFCHSYQVRVLVVFCAFALKSLIYVFAFFLFFLFLAAISALCQFGAVFSAPPIVSAAKSYAAVSTPPIRPRRHFVRRHFGAAK